MLRVTVEIWPFGSKAAKRTLGVAEIANDATGSKTKGNYNYRLYDAGGKLWKSGRVEDFPRQCLLAFDLLYRALKDAIGERNGN